MSSNKQSLGKVSDLDSISITEYEKDNFNLHSMINNTETSLVTSESYKNIINQAKKLNKNRISSDYKNVMSLKGGSLIVSETSDNNNSVVQKYGDFSSTSSAFMTEIMGNNRQTGGNALSATSSAFMTEIMGDKQTGGNALSATSSAFMTEIMRKNGQTGGNALSATSSAFMTEIMDNNKQSKINDISATSSAFMTEIMNNDKQIGGNNEIDLSSTSSAFLTELLGGAPRKKVGKKAGGIKKKGGKDEENKEDILDSSSSPISSSSDDAEETDDTEETEETDDETEDTESDAPKAGFVNGTRYLLSETSRVSETDMTTSSLSTEDLRFFKR